MATMISHWLTIWPFIVFAHAHLRTGTALRIQQGRGASWHREANESVGAHVTSPTKRHQAALPSNHGGVETAILADLPADAVFDGVRWCPKNMSMTFEEYMALNDTARNRANREDKICDERPNVGRAAFALIGQP